MCGTSTTVELEGMIGIEACGGERKRRLGEEIMQVCIYGGEVGKAMREAKKDPVGSD